MAKQSLTAMSVDALLKLRDDIGTALKSRAAGLRDELRAIGRDYADVGRIAVYGRSKLAGKTVAPKYRDPATGETWSGRGAPARWLVTYEKQGRKRDEFLIGKTAKAAAKKAHTKKKRRAGRRKKR